MPRQLKNNSQTKFTSRSSHSEIKTYFLSLPHHNLKSSSLQVVQPQQQKTHKILSKRIFEKI